MISYLTENLAKVKEIHQAVLSNVSMVSQGENPLFSNFVQNLHFKDSGLQIFPICF